MATYVIDADIPRPIHLGADPWRLRRLTDITVVFGRNGSGKSALLRAVRNQAPERRHYVSPERGGDIGFNPDRVALQFQGGNRANSTGGNAAPNFSEEVIARILVYLTKRGACRDTNVGTPPKSWSGSSERCCQNWCSPFADPIHPFEFNVPTRGAMSPQSNPSVVVRRSFQARPRSRHHLCDVGIRRPGRANPPHRRTRSSPSPGLPATTRRVHRDSR